MASDNPSSDIVSSLKPMAHTAMNDATTDTGSASPVMTVDRHEFRNRNTTSTVSSAPSSSASSTFFTAAVTRTPESLTTSIRVPEGSVFSIRATCSRILSLTSVVLYPWAFLMSMPTAWRPS